MDSQLTEREIAEQGMALLREVLRSTWTVELQAEPDLRATIGLQNVGPAMLLVEAKKRFRPQDLDALMGRLGRRLRAIGGRYDILVISDYLTPKSREALVSEGINFIDLTGNIKIELDYPGISIERSGRAGTPSRQEAASLRGATAGRLIRFLIDVRPPYGVVDIEAATGMNRGYISRLLDAAADEGLITREKRAVVTDCDWKALIRHRARDVELFKTNKASLYIARISLDGAIGEILGRPMASQLAITGSAAAYRMDPLVAITSLAIYSNAPRLEVEDALQLTPATEGANVAILVPPDRSIFVLSRWWAGIQYVAPSQVAIDCLSGPGRMPAEGEAVIEWMSKNVGEWRLSGIDEFRSKIREAE